MMWLVISIILASAAGSLSYYDECYIEDIGKCREDVEPVTRFPETAEELQEVCNYVKAAGTCAMEALRKCGHEEHSKSVQNMLNFVKLACEEDNPIFTVISSNLQCIAPVAEEMDDLCHQPDYTEKNFEILNTHFDSIYESDVEEDFKKCFSSVWRVLCPSVVADVRCGPEVKEAVLQILAHTDERHITCTEEMLEELEPTYELFETVIRDELSVKDGLENRK